MKTKSDAPKKDKAKQLSAQNRPKHPEQNSFKKNAVTKEGTTRVRREAPAPAAPASRPAKTEQAFKGSGKGTPSDFSASSKPAGRGKGFAGSDSVGRGKALSHAPVPEGEERRSSTKGKTFRTERPAAMPAAKASDRPDAKTTARGAKPSPKGQPRQERSTREEQKPLLRSGQVVELRVDSVNDEGYGVARIEGTKVLVANGLAGETLVAKITYVGRREAFANTIKLLKPSLDRAPSPACGMGRACDGCGLIQMRYPAQLAWKKGLVTRHIGRHASLSGVKINDTIGSPREVGYRNTAKLVVAGKHSEPVIGIYKRNTHDVLEIENCALHHPLINKVVKAVKAGIKKGKVPIYNPKSEMGLLRYVVVRVAEPSDQVMVVFVTTDQGYNEMHHLAKFVQKEVPQVAVVAQNINTSTGNVIFGNRDRFITKTHTLKAFVGEKVFHLSPHSFFQVNSGAAGIIYEKVREWAKLTGEERVLDVYCGIGGISLYLAAQAAEVTGIEFVEAAVADATINAALNHAENCHFEAGDAAHLVEEMAEEGGADLVVLNPPRKGCDEKVLKSVAALGPARIIYVSCSPETLARDLDILSRLGYRTLEIQPVDMFPQTVHVEDVALLEKISG